MLRDEDAWADPPLVAATAAEDEDEGDAKGAAGAWWNSECVGDRRLKGVRAGGGGCGPGWVAELLLLLPGFRMSRRRLSPSSCDRASTVEWKLDSISTARARALREGWRWGGAIGHP